MNYQLLLEKELANLTNVPRLLLHVCCAPCSSYVLEYLSNYFAITVFYYNPNIDTNEEYEKRLNEAKRFIKEFPSKYPINLVEVGYDHESFMKMSKGLENEKEGGSRCFKCYRLRLEKTFAYAKANHFDYVTTTLTISPLKNSQKINEIGHDLSTKWQVKYLYSDFKKKEGYKRSIILSKQYHLYRQNYCGCQYSKPKEILFKVN